MISFDHFNNIDELLRYSALLVKPFYEFDKDLGLITEWEYKYHKILNSKNTNEKRKGFLLNKIETELDSVIDGVCNSLYDIYKKWLDAHAITDPRQWAIQRSSDVEGYGSLEALKYEFKHYGGNNFEEEFLYTNIKHLKGIFGDYMDDIIGMYRDDLDYYEKMGDSDQIGYLNDQIDILENIDLDTEDGLIYFLDQYIDDKDIFLENIANKYNLEFMIIDFYEKKVFPLWFDFWSEQGIENTRSIIEDIARRLKFTDKSNFMDNIVSINMALNAAHQTGPMLDYINLHYPNIDEDFLDNLSNKDEDEISSWNKDLLELGVW